MKKSDYTVNDFKIWAARQAGFDFQPYPTFKKTIYNTGDYASVGNRIYKSLVETNKWNPTDVDWYLDTIPVWSAKEWAQGDLCVGADGRVYMATIATESEPPANAWTEQTVDQLRARFGIVWQNQTPDWVEGVYNAGDVVLYAPTMYLYMSMSDDNTSEPSKDASWVRLCERKIADRFDDVQPWAKPISYSVGDRVIAQDATTFKFYVYESTVDDNYADPSTTTDSEQNDVGDISAVILDSEIAEAMTEAKFKFNCALFPDLAERKTAFSLLVAFFLSYDRQMAATGIESGYKGIPASKKIGEMSISYMADPSMTSGSELAAFFARNPYGLKYYNLIRPRLKAMAITIGRTTSV